ncbi:MAG: DUF86 domain-containing protein [Aeromicrobium sp.]|uniref:HepT-like ribonuclease domain-containing protein n=1 Tax=Aeromicrobium sp. TaxID=1871063 RepID=UPI0039E4F4A9
MSPSPAAQTFIDAYDERTAYALLDFVAHAEMSRRSITSVSHADYEDSLVLQLAAEAMVSRLGETVRRMDRQFKDDHPHVPWSDIQHARNRVVHEYHHVRHLVLWKALTGHLPSNVESVQAIIDEHELTTMPSYQPPLLHAQIRENRSDPERQWQPAADPSDG